MNIFEVHFHYRFFDPPLVFKTDADGGIDAFFLQTVGQNGALNFITKKKNVDAMGFHDEIVEKAVVKGHVHTAVF